MRPIPDSARELVMEFEGLKLESYLCPAGVATIGWGHTSGVHLGMRITKDTARKYLMDDLKTAAARVEARVGRAVVDALPEPRYAALLSFTLNLGTGDPDKPEWKIWGLLRAQNWDAIPAQLARFINSGGKKSAGLIRRRAAEVALWHEADAVEENPPSSFTREEPTPPTPEPVKPMVQSKTVWTGVGQIVGSISAGALAVQQTIAPHAASAAFLGKAVAALGILMAVSGVLLLAIKTLEKREAKR